MRVAFIGASSFGLRCLEEVTRLPGISVVGVVTNPKTFGISYSEKPVTNVLHADFVAWAAIRSLPCFAMQQTMNDKALLEWLRVIEPQLFVVVGWYHMLPRTIREIAPAVGLHASLLPDYSGGAPLVWAMINGEKETGISLFQLADGVDSGPIYGQAREEIRPDDTIATLYSRIELRGLELLQNHLPKIADGTVIPWVQDESKRRVFAQRSPADGRICWQWDAEYIDRFIRAQTRPYPGAFTMLGGRKLTIWAASLRNHSVGEEPGFVARDGSCYSVCCGTGAIHLTALQCGDTVYVGEEMIDLLGSGGQWLGA